MHSVRLSANGVVPQPSLFPVLHKYLQLIPESFSDPIKDERYIFFSIFHILSNASLFPIFKNITIFFFYENYCLYVSIIPVLLNLNFTAEYLSTNLEQILKFTLL